METKGRCCYLWYRILFTSLIYFHLQCPLLQLTVIDLVHTLISLSFAIIYVVDDFAMIILLFSKISWHFINQWNLFCYIYIYIYAVAGIHVLWHYIHVPTFCSLSCQATPSLSQTHGGKQRAACWVSRSAALRKYIKLGC